MNSLSSLAGQRRKADRLPSRLPIYELPRREPI
jgi:hypothetical protein